MSMVFPGMDPYLENPQIWTGLHSRLIVYIADAITTRVRPRYVAAVEERVYLEGHERSTRPDVSVRQTPPERRGGGVAVLEAEADAPVVVRAGFEPVRETYVTILDLHAGQKVVTVIEVVSPTNKRAGTPGRESYVTKQREVLSGDVHLVEIDLLRGGTHVVAVPEEVARSTRPYDTLTCVNRAGGLRDPFELYPRTLRERLPRIRIPLAGDDPDVPLDVQAVLNQAYEAGAYRDRIDYGRPSEPPLPDPDREWAAGLVGPAGAPPLS